MEKDIKTLVLFKVGDWFVWAANECTHLVQRRRKIENRSLSDYDKEIMGSSTAGKCIYLQQFMKKIPHFFFWIEIYYPNGYVTKKS